MAAKRIAGLIFSKKKLIKIKSSILSSKMSRGIS